MQKIVYLNHDASQSYTIGVTDDYLERFTMDDVIKLLDQSCIYQCNCGYDPCRWSLFLQEVPNEDRNP